MLSPACQSFRRSSIPTIEISDELLTHVKVWQKVQEADLPTPQQTITAPTTTSDERKKEWIILKTPNSALRLKINEVLQLLFHLPGNINSKTPPKIEFNVLEKNLKTRFYNPSLDHLETILPLSLKQNWKILSEKIKETFHRMAPISLSMHKEGYVSHYKRAISNTALPINIDAAGRTYIIAKLNTHTPPFEQGLVKKLFFAVDTHTLRPAALAKINLLNHCEMTPGRIKKDILQEIALQRSFTSPEFVKILHWCTYFGKNNEEKVCIMMEFCDLVLDKYFEDRALDRKKAAKQEEMWNIIEDICSALVQLESKKIHHRDIKPANIFLVKTENGLRAKLGDFGFATHIADEVAEPRACGSPEYVSPEFHLAHKVIKQSNESIKWCDARIEVSMSQKKLADIYTKEALEIIANSDQAVYASLSDLVQNKFIKAAEIEKDANEIICKARSEREEACKIHAENAIRAGDTKGDIWAFGLILAQLRTGKYPSDFLFTEDTIYWSNFKYMDELGNLTQQQIDKAFSSKRTKRDLEELNRMMLKLDPKQRISAKDCLDEIRRLRQRKIAFA